ncbi:glycosyltransferase [Dactylosporangium vinaceum]|uniref:Glycosyltransferase family 2 protein n=1 Tax=Dactylosporangium vinaceum TaxID=53362 RepID=A0ABV5MKZ7_9ACTN|nr:glycosyltransferase [Dactylosporangium vinaceum]UAB93999.1 glycosyltransferase [Dactylosporangium vinaceum]
MTVRLSVIIPAYDNASQLDVTLGSLTRQTLPAGEFEVIVCDDGSPAPLAPVADKYADRLTIACVRAEQNRGRSANRNAGAAAARADVLVFLDSDTVAHPDLLGLHAGFHAGRGGRPGVLLGRRFDIDWAGVDALRRGEPLTAAMLDGYRGDPRDVNVVLPQHRADFQRAPWLLGFSHNVSMDRATFAAVGGFDEAMVRWGLEDTELFYRVFHHHGGAPEVFALSDDAVAYHLPHYRPTRALLATLDNIGYVTRKHRRWDFEAMHSPGTLGEILGRVRLYGDAIAACRRLGLGRPAGDEDLASTRTLAIGFGVAGLALGEGSHTFDHAAEPSPTNWHLLGLMLQHFKTGQFERIVNIDLWRFMMPEDLNLFVTKGLMKADRIDLVATDGGPDPATLLPLPFVADLGYVAELLGSHFKVATAASGGRTVLSVR